MADIPVDELDGKFQKWKRKILPIIIAIGTLATTYWVTIQIVEHHRKKANQEEKKQTPPSAANIPPSSSQQDSAYAENESTELGGPYLYGLESSIPRIDVVVHKEAIPALIKDLNEGDDKKRIRAASLLGNTIDLNRKVVDALRKALKDENPDVRKNAISSLGLLRGKSKKAVPDLADVMKTETDKKIRKSACYALVEIGPDAEAATPTLISLLNDSAFWISGGSCIQKALGAIGPQALPLMKKSMDTDDRKLKRNIIQTVEKEFGPAGADFLPVLLKALDDESPEVRKHAAMALEKMGKAGVPAFPKLKTLLKDKDSQVQICATHALGALAKHDDSVIDNLIEQLKNGPNKTGAAYNLGEIGPSASAAIPYLIEELDAEDWNLRLSAAKALGKMGPAAIEAKPKIEPLLNDENEIVRSHAQRALDDLGRSQEEHGQKDPMWDIFSSKESESVYLGKIAAMPDSEKAQTAKELIQWRGWRENKIGGDSPDLFYYISKPLVAIGAAADPVYMQLIKDDDPYNRYGTVKTLLSRDDTPEKFIPVLIERLDDEKEAIQYYSILALKKYGPEAKPAVPKFIELLRSDNKYIPSRAREALQNVSPNAIDLLKEELNNSAPVNRAAAAKALGGWIPYQYSAGAYQREYALNEVTNAVPALELATKDDAEEVKRAASKAITDINLAKAQVYKEIAPDDAEKKKDSLRPLEKMFLDETADVNARMNVFKKIVEVDPESRSKYKSQLIDIFKKSADGTPEPNGIYAFDAASKELSQMKLGEEGKELIPYALKALDYKCHAGPGGAVRFLGSLGPYAEDAIPALTDALNHRCRSVHETAAMALGNIGPKAKKAVPEIIKSLENSKYDWQRERYIEALKKIGTKKALRAAERYQK
jgi:HEAT repeat protein